MIIGIVGIIVLILSLILNGLFDAFNLGDGPLSITSISIFATFFGLISFVSMFTFHASASMSAFVGSLSGFGAGLLSWLVMRKVSRIEDTDVFRFSDLKDTKGYVVIPIPDDNGLGEIVVSHKGYDRHVPARSKTGEKIPYGASVNVVDTVSSTWALVVEDKETS